MRADQQLSIHMGGDSFQIVCDDPDVITDLRAALAPHVVEGQALPGFKISAPNGGNRLWVILASDGTVLARSTDRSIVVRILLRHLSALDAPQPSRTQRLGLVGLAGPSGIVFVDPRLIRQQPPIERQISRAGLALIDSPFQQVEIDGTSELANLATDVAPTDTAIDAHVHPALASGPVHGLMWSADTEAIESTPGQVAHALASVARSGSHAERVDFGIAWADKIQTQQVNRYEKNSMLTAATKLAG